MYAERVSKPGPHPAMRDVARVLERQGRPLTPAQRVPAERQFSADLSHVRVHDDAPARNSAADLGARGYAWGEHVVLGANSRPDTLTHELAHVVQQGAAPGQGAPRLGARGDALERDAHAAADGARPPSLRAAERSVQMQPDDPNHARLHMPQSHSGFQRPPLSLGAGQLELHMMPEDSRRIDSYLAEHRFDLRQFNPALDGEATSIDAIVERVRPLLTPHAATSEIRRYIEGRFSALRTRALLHPGLGAAAGSAPGPRADVPSQLFLPASSLPRRSGGGSAQAQPIQGWQWVLQLATQVAAHQDISGRSNPPTDVTMQFQAARSFAGHADNEQGSEMQGMVQFGYNVTTGQVTVMAGAQYTEVFYLFNGHLQLGGFAQIMAGVAAGGGPVSAQIQPSVGAQAVVQIAKPRIGGREVSLAASAQVFRGLTFTPGGTSTQDTGGGIGFQASF
ncbi:MAG: DUF4157 domain-containing protein [Rhizomicrobium sp.]